MKVKKVHPNPPPPSVAAGDSFTILTLLPAAILTLISVLSVQDRHVLAYMLTRSLQSANQSFEKQRNGKRLISTTTYPQQRHHKPPLFDCDCFECYIWYWFKWDTSPNRELIHQAIEAFEEQNLSDDMFLPPKKKGKKKGGRRLSGKCGDCSSASGKNSPNFGRDIKGEKGSVVEKKVVAEGLVKEVVAPAAAAADIKGLARKLLPLLPEVLGLLNFRLWSLLNPNFM